MGPQNPKSGPFRGPKFGTAWRCRVGDFDGISNAGPFGGPDFGTARRSRFQFEAALKMGPAASKMGPLGGPKTGTVFGRPRASFASPAFRFPRLRGGQNLASLRRVVVALPTPSGRATGCSEKASEEPCVTQTSPPFSGPPGGPKFGTALEGAGVPNQKGMFRDRRKEWRILKS